MKFNPPGSRAKASQRPCESLIRDRFKCPRKGGDVGGEGPAHKYAAWQDCMLRSSSNGNWLMRHSRSRPQSQRSLISRPRNEWVNIPKQSLNTGMSIWRSRWSMARVWSLSMERKYGTCACKNSSVSEEWPLLTTRCRVCCRSPWRSAATNLSKLSGLPLGCLERDFMD